MRYQVQYPVYLDELTYMAVKDLIGKLGEQDGEVISRIVVAWLAENGYLTRFEAKRLERKE